MQKNNKGIPNFKSGDIQGTFVENLHGSGLFALAGMPRLVLLTLPYFLHEPCRNNLIGFF
jgi:hypothetical protein